MAARPAPEGSRGGRPWRCEDGCVIVRFRLTPKSARSAIEGIGDTTEGPAVLARVNAVPEDGAANRALEKLVATWLDVPKRTVMLTNGAKSRIKSLAVSGPPELIVGKLIDRLARPGHVGA